MYNVSALLLDDALLNYVVTEVVLFSVVAFKTLNISQGSVATQLSCGGIFSDSIITNFVWFWEWTNFENRWIFGKVNAYKNCANFWGHPAVGLVMFRDNCRSEQVPPWQTGGDRDTGDRQQQSPRAADCTHQQDSTITRQLKSLLFSLLLTEISSNVWISDVDYRFFVM